MIEVDQKSTAKATLLDNLLPFGQPDVLALKLPRWPGSRKEIHQYVVEAEVPVNDGTHIDESFMD